MILVVTSMALLAQLQEKGEKKIPQKLKLVLLLGPFFLTLK